jgi:hypothetical protein
LYQQQPIVLNACADQRIVLKMMDLTAIGH